MFIDLPNQLISRVDYCWLLKQGVETKVPVAEELTKGPGGKEVSEYRKKNNRVPSWFFCSRHCRFLSWSNRRRRRKSKKMCSGESGWSGQGLYSSRVRRMWKTHVPACVIDREASPSSTGHPTKGRKPLHQMNTAPLRIAWWQKNIHQLLLPPSTCFPSQ